MRAIFRMTILISAVLGLPASAEADWRDKVLLAVDAFNGYVRPHALIVKSTKPLSSRSWTMPGSPPGYVVIASSISCINVRVDILGVTLSTPMVKTDAVTLDTKSCKPAEGGIGELEILTCSLKCG